MKHHSAHAALAWTYGGVAARIICQFTINIAIARILGPEPYGLYSCSLFVMSLANLISDGGITSSIIKVETVDPREIAGAWCFQFLVSLALCLAIVFLAPWVALAFHAPKVAPVLAVMALAFPLNALSSTSVALLRRALRMKSIQIVLTLSFIIAFGAVGLPLAWYGAGVWAIVTAQLTLAGLQSIILISLYRPAIAWPVWPRRLFGFGAWSVFGSLASWGHTNLPQMILTHAFGVVPLGAYNRLAMFTDQTLPICMGPLQQVIFPALSRATDPEHRRRIIRAGYRGVVLIYLPCMAVLALFPEVVVAGLLGERYLAQAHLLTPMALATVAVSLSALSPAIMSSAGKPKNDFLASVMTLPVAVGVALAASRFDLETVCWGICLSVWVRLSVSLLMARYTGAVRLHDVAAAVVGILPTMALAVAGAWAGALAGRPYAHGIALACLLAGAGTGYLAGVAMTWKRVLPESVVQKVQDRFRR